MNASLSCIWSICQRVQIGSWLPIIRASSIICLSFLAQITITPPKWTFLWKKNTSFSNIFYISTVLSLEKVHNHGPWTVILKYFVFILYFWTCDKSSQLHQVNLVLHSLWANLFLPKRINLFRCIENQKKLPDGIDVVWDWWDWFLVQTPSF